MFVRFDGLPATKGIGGANRIGFAALLTVAFLSWIFSRCPDLYGQTASQRGREADREAQAAMARGQFVDAVAKYQEALAISPRDAGAEIGLAQAYRGVHNYEQAKEVLEQAMREHPKNAAAVAALGDLEIEMQTYPAAVEHLRESLALKPDDEAARIRLAVACKSLGDVATALTELAKVLARDPKSALAHYERTQIYSDQNQDNAALADAQRAVDLQPNRAGRLLLAKILLRPASGAATVETKERCSNAVETLEPLMPEHRQDSEALFLLSRAYQCAGRDKDAQKALADFEIASKNDRAAKENQTEAKHLVQQANDAAMKNDFHGALDFLQQALEQDPNYGAAYSQLAKLYYSAGNMEKASEAIDKAVALDPYQPDFLYVNGKILEKEGKLEEALAMFERATLVNPKESDAFFEMGEIYRQRNERAKALAAYRKAVDLAPDDAEYRKALEAMK